MSVISRQLLRARPQELGKIKIGGKGEERQSSGGKTFRLPVKYDHFVITTRRRGEDGNFERDEAIHAKLGDEPRELAGVLMYPTVEENFHAEMVQYKGREKVWSCDGETARNLKTDQAGECPRLKGGECRCKPYMRLTMQLWDAPVMGYHVFRSTSWETTNNLQTALEELFDTFGTLFKAPVKLILYPATVEYQEGNQSKSSTAYMVGLTLAYSMEDVAERMVAAKRIMTTTREQLRMLSSGVQQDLAERDAEEAADIADEYFPEGAVQASVGTQERLDGFKQDLGKEGQDFEVVEDEAGEPDAGASPVEDPEYQRAKGHYFALVGKLEWSPVQRKLWQEQRGLPHSAADFTTADFELAVALIERGETEIEYPTETNGGGAAEEPEPATPFDEMP